MPDYGYLKELEFDGDVTPLGHYNISTWSSKYKTEANGGKSCKFMIATENVNSRGILTITCISINKRSLIIIPIDRSKPCGKYTVLADDGLLSKIKIDSNSSNTSTTYSIECNNVFMCNVSVQQSISCKIIDSSYSGSFTELEKSPACLPQPQILTEDIHYGDELPEAGTAGRIFFVKVD